MNKQQASVRPRRKTLLRIKPSVAAIYFGLFAFIIAIISVGYSSPRDSKTVVNASNVNQSNVVQQTSVDDVISTNVAAGVAKTVNLPIATSVANLAVSAQTESEFAQSNVTSTVKPQIIESSQENRSVISYTVKAGDTASSVAAHYGISAQTVKWANNLTSDSISVGSTLRILPIDGVLYNVKSGDTIESIAKKYNVDVTRLILVNDLDVSGLKSDVSIILPGGILPENERPGYVAPVVNYYAGIGSGFGGRTWNIGYGTGSCPQYGYGQCTCYAFSRRVQLGLPVGGSNGIPQWGNASSWAQLARVAGLAVNSTPAVGAIMQNGGGLNGWGHVAIVESIAANGDLSISEMNAYVPGGGWNIVSGRIVPAGDVGQYLYIH